MPNLNIVIDKSLLAEVNFAAAKADLNQRDWVIKALAEAVARPVVEKARPVDPADMAARVANQMRPPHDTKTCRVYGCLQCG